ncbi:MAG: hypothetical protein HKP30_08350, partial [Myxococcales bacterium]|nr:hypothetical protein [Myxococcales bacterium]
RLVSHPASESVACEAVLTTTGRFVDVSEIRLEPGDRVELADDGRTLALRGRLANRTRASLDGERRIPDEDGLAFRTDPSDAPIVLQRLALEDGGAVALRAGAGRALEAVPFAFDVTRPDASVRDVAELLRDAPAMQTPAEAYLAVIRPPETHEALSEPLRDRLRALGYLDPEAEAE